MTFYIILPVFATFFNLLLALLVFQHRRESRAVKVFLFCLLSMAAWGLTIYLMRASPDLERALFWEKWVFATFPAVAVFYFHFTTLFTRIKLPRWVVPLSYLVGIACISLAPIGFVVRGMQIKAYGYAPVFGPLIFPYWTVLYGFAITGLAFVLRALKTLKSADERNRASYVALGTVFALLGIVTDALPVFGIPVYPLGIIGNIFFAFIITIAVARYQLLDIRVIARKGIYYSLSSAFIFGLAVACIFLINRLFPWEKISLLVRVGVVVIVAMAFYPLLGRIQRLVDRLFYRERYDYLKALEEFSQQTKSLIDLAQLSHSLTGMIKRAMQANKVYLMVPSLETGDFITVSSSETSQPEPLGLERTNPVVDWLSSHVGFLHSEDMEVSARLQGLTATQRKVLAEIGGEIYVPLKAKDELAGILILGSKQSRAPYTQEDTRLLSTVASQIAIALDNARLYRELARQVEELKETQAQLIRSAKLAAVGELAANVAHEVNNPLQSVLNYSFILSERLSDDDPRKVEVKALEDEALRAQGIVRSLLDFARREEPRKQDLEINTLVQSVIPLAKLRTETAGIRLVEDYTPDIPPVSADAEQLKQVFLNLITNAVDAMPDGGKLTIATRGQDGRVIILFSDTGQGIPAQYLPKIFDPFFTTKPRAKGTGLGLKVSLRIVESHGGTIGVESQQGKGTTFVVTLPRSNTRGLD